MTKNKIVIVVAGFFVLISFFIPAFIAHDNFSDSIRQTPQNAFVWVDLKKTNTLLFSELKQKDYVQSYLRHYFFPWHFSHVDNLLALKRMNESAVHYFHRYPGYGINHLPNDPKWIKSIANNMDMTHFPNARTKAITVQTTNIRSLPTDEPSFGNFNQAGEGYPFDYFQATTLPANTPALVIQKTRDGAWSFILTSAVDGWVPSTALAVVSNSFIKCWETRHFFTLTKNNIAIVDDRGVMRFTADIGKIFPSISKNSLLIAVANANQRAVIKIIKRNSSVFSAWPLRPTQKNIAKTMNKMLGVKYGWGGIAGNSDCSQTVMNLFGTFGIWLPRHSELQAQAGRIISLLHKTNKEKEKIIIAQGVPFLTLLSMPGHIVVYIGEKHGTIAIFQTAWGLRTRNVFGQAGRAIIGKTVITPVDLGKYDINVTKTWLDEIDAMTVL